MLNINNSSTNVRTNDEPILMWLRVLSNVLYFNVAKSFIKCAVKSIGLFIGIGVETTVINIQSVILLSGDRKLL